MHTGMRMVGPFPLGARSRSLVWEMSKREVAGRYRGMNFGMLWSLLQPFLMLGVYTMAFGQILQSRWPGASDKTSFALILFVGLVVHGFLAECVSKAPSLVAGNVAYVKRIIFPLEILPWPVLASGLFHLAANLVVLAGFMLVSGRPVPATALLLPAVIAPLCLVALGTMWFFAALGVYFRDINQLIGPVLTALLFLSSAIVPPAATPARFRAVFEANPITLIIDSARQVLLAGTQPDWLRLLAYSAVAFAWSMLGYLAFVRLRKGFANVL